MKEVRNNFKFKIIMVRTDNGLEFTNRLISEYKTTLFKMYLKKYNINHDFIKSYTPKHNGKVKNFIAKIRNGFIKSAVSIR